MIHPIQFHPLASSQKIRKGGYACQGWKSLPGGIAPDGIMDQLFSVPEMGVDRHTIIVGRARGLLGATGEAG
jgi:hypothetical protein